MQRYSRLQSQVVNTDVPEYWSSNSKAIKGYGDTDSPSFPYKMKKLCSVSK
jgi:hypothetical protein